MPEIAAGRSCSCGMPKNRSKHSGCRNFWIVTVSSVHAIAITIIITLARPSSVHIDCPSSSFQKLLCAQHARACVKQVSSARHVRLIAMSQWGVMWNWKATRKPICEFLSPNFRQAVINFRNQLSPGVVSDFSRCSSAVLRTMTDVSLFATELIKNNEVLVFYLLTFAVMNCAKIAVRFPVNRFLQSRVIINKAAGFCNRELCILWSIRKYFCEICLFLNDALVCEIFWKYDFICLFAEPDRL